MNGVSFLVGFQILDSNIHESFTGCLGRPRNVGCNETVGQSDKRIAVSWRFLGQYVNARSIYLALLQRLGQSRVVDEWAAPGIDEDGRWLHPLQRLAVNEMAGIGREWAMQTYHIALRK